MAETLLAFDFGEKRVGVAVGESFLRTARPLSTLKVPSAQLLAAIAPLVNEWQPARFVVGRPSHPDGAPHAMTARCERFARQLSAHFHRPAALVDERYSSVDAATALSARGKRGEAMKSALDAEAATIILERYFESLA